MRYYKEKVGLYWTLLHSLDEETNLVCTYCEGDCIKRTDLTITNFRDLAEISEEDFILELL